MKNYLKQEEQEKDTVPHLSTETFDTVTSSSSSSSDSGSGSSNIAVATNTINSRCRKTVDRKLLTAVYHQGMKEWKARLPSNMLIDASHKCNTGPTKCRVSNLPITVYTVRPDVISLAPGQTGSAPSPALAAQTPSSANQQYHVCTEWCPNRNSHGPNYVKYFSVDNLFVCEDYGVFHVCGEAQCDTEVSKKKGQELYCSMTGLVLGTPYYDTSSAPSGRNAYTKSDAQFALRHSSSVVKSVRQQQQPAAEATRVELSPSQQWLLTMGVSQEEFDTVYNLLDHILFSPYRRSKEKDLLIKAHNAAKKRVVDYVRACKETGTGFCNLCYAHTLYVDTLQKSNLPVLIIINSVAKHRFTSFYTHFLITMYAKLRKYVFEELLKHENAEATVVAAVEKRAQQRGSSSSNTLGRKRKERSLRCSSVPGEGVMSFDWSGSGNGSSHSSSSSNNNRKKSKIGRKSQASHLISLNIDTFVLPFLHILSNGLSLRNPECTIYWQHRALKPFLPSEKNIGWFGCNRSTYVSVINAVKQCIIKLVRKNGLEPSVLQVTSFDVHEIKTMTAEKMAEMFRHKNSQL